MKTHKIITVAATVVIVLLGQAAYAQSQPAPVPEPSTWLAGALLLVPLGVSALRSMRKNK